MNFLRRLFAPRNSAYHVTFMVQGKHHGDYAYGTRILGLDRGPGLCAKNMDAFVDVIRTVQVGDVPPSPDNCVVILNIIPLEPG